MTVADRLREIVAALPDGSAVTLPASTLGAWLADDAPAVPPAQLATEPTSWREKLWTVAADTRLGVKELAEALDRSSDWCYRAVSPKLSTERGREPLPCSRLDGVLVFTVGAVRHWLDSSAVTVNPDPRRAQLHTKEARVRPSMFDEQGNRFVAL